MDEHHVALKEFILKILEEQEKTRKVESEANKTALKLAEAETIRHLALEFVRQNKYDADIKRISDDILVIQTRHDNRTRNTSIFAIIAVALSLASLIKEFFI